MKRMNRIICVTFSVLVLICIASLTVFGANTVIDDRSGFLFESEKNECMDIIKEVSAKYNINIHIVTDDFYDGTYDDAGKDFAFDYYRGIYGDSVVNGVILAVDNLGGAGNRYVYILASGICSEHINEYDIDDITLELQNYIVDDDIKGCIVYFLNSVDYYMNKEPTTEDYGYYDNDYNNSDDNYDYDSSSYRIASIKANAGKIILFGLIGGIAGAVVSVLIVTRGYKQFGVVKGIDANAVSSVHLNASTDNVINRVVTTRRIPKDPPPDSHSDGGHSSGFSGGSSSDGFSGGGRGF
ncbi:MAG: TPM domain-containing protein [Oscillospiraceae bacterium]|nr:TPM domain-containing protein [Oscillospiraceae bacterium]